MIQGVDFSLYRNKLQNKGFRFRNDDGTFFDFTDSTIRMDIYLNGPNENPISIQGEITLNTADVKFTIPASNLTELGSFEYIILQTKGENQIPLLRGVITVNEYVPFSDSIESFLATELPTGMTLDNNYVNQKIRYWRLFLQDAFSVSDSMVNVDSAWPTLVNILIAKLVAYDALIMAVKGNLFTIFGSSSNYQSDSSSTSNGDVKSITTGPTQVEFYPTGETVNSVIKSVTSSGNSSSTSIFTQMAEDLCGLASKLTLKLPMCKAEKTVVIFQNFRKETRRNINKHISRG